MAPMVGSTQALLVAVALFVGGHFVLSSVPVREGLIKALGINGFRLIYSALSRLNSQEPHTQAPNVYTNSLLGPQRLK